MEKALTQEEISALAHAAAEGAAAPGEPARTRNYTPLVFGKASSLTKQQVRDVAQTHESFIYNLKNRLSAIVQTPSEVALESVDELLYSEFVQSIPKDAYLASVNVQPTRSLAILRLDLGVALAMIDLMLGGNGKPAAVARQITEIEEKVLQIVLDMICEELQAAWRQIVEIDFSFDQSHRSADLFRLMSSYEKILFLSFEIRMGSVSGMLTLAFPAAASSILVRKLAKKSARTQAQSPASQNRLRGRLEACIFPVELLLPPTKLKGKDLLALEAGQTLLIQHPLQQPAVVHVAGHKMFSAYPVRNGRQRGGLIREKFSFSSEKVSE